MVVDYLCARWCGRHEKTEVTGNMTLNHATDNQPLFHVLAGMLPDTSVICFDLDLRFTSAEGQGLARSVIPAAMFKGRLLHELFSPEFVATYEPLMTRTLQGERLTFEGIFADRHYTVHTAPIRDEHGTITGGMAVSIENTESYKSSENLRTSLRRYEALFQQSNDAVFILALDGQHVAANQRAAGMLGYTPDEIVNKSFRDVVAPSEHGGSENVLARLLAGEHVPPYERLFRRKDGSVVNTEVNVELVSDTDGTPIHIQSIVRDITERKQAEEELRLSEARYRAIVEFQTELVCRYTPDTTLTFVNEAYCRYYNVRAEDIIGKSFLTLIPESDHARMHEMLEATWNAPETRTHEYETVLSDGTRRWQSWVDRVIRDADGNLLEVQAVGRDITELKRAQEQALQLEMEQERSRILTHFVQTAMHEFRTPLTIIYNSTFLMAKSEERESRRKFLDRVETQIQLLTHLLDMLIEMTRINNGMAFNFDQANVNDYVRRSLDAIRSTAAARNLELNLELYPEVLTASLDGLQFERALFHLLDNAVRFTPAGGSITLRTDHTGEHIAVQVIDTGPGIPEDDLPHIFNAFWRQDSAHTTPGFGLGLPIARRIIELHDGQLEVDTAPGQGTCFTIFLPV